MREIIQYEAFDGELFAHKQECEEYESRFQHFSDCIRFYDSDMNEVPINPIEDEDSVMDAYNWRAIYIEILPVNGCKELTHFFIDIYYGMCIEHGDSGYEAGLYKYDEVHGDFIKS